MGTQAADGLGGSEAVRSIALTGFADVRAADPLAGGGESGALMRSIDWSATPLGPVETWSPTLKTMVSFLLANRFPLLLWWGPEYIQLYNDAYRPVLGAKHPRSMGQPTRECWTEIWHVIGPLIDTPFRGGPATWMEDILLEINRHGFVEETHFTIAYSPVPDAMAPRGIGGVLATVHEITEQVIGERRVLALRDLGTRSLAEAQTSEQACATAAEILEKHARDVPFALIYLLDPDGKRLRLAGIAGTQRGSPISPDVIEAGGADVWPVWDALERESMAVVQNLPARFTELPVGMWSEPAHTGVVVPIASNIAHRPAGVLIAGVSPRHAFDEQYASFFELVTRQVSTAIANARAYEDERKRAEALAELDRAKTTFFSNVSHEFRTPLTLLLGPARDALEDPTVSPQQHRRLELIHRNALRMQRLVNTLLDFSRIEAGRADAVFEPTDIGTYTAELASAFRSAVEKAGLSFVIDTTPLDEPAYVDRDMWEKVVLNLVSNAFKHTFAGEIRVSVRPTDSDVELVVRDTGVGIAADQLPNLFERFHRVANAKSRTHEGTGIGLALVQELVRLHGGEVGVRSVVGSGSTFTVRIPRGSAHLPPEQVGGVRARASTATGTTPFIEEATRWLPNDWETVEQPIDGTLDDATLEPSVAHATILVVDDNADMREYVARLLRDRGWTVETAADGLAALDFVRRAPPDLVLSDVMMPGLDGFAFMRKLRADATTAEIPIIMLSARAGEEARIEGLGAGADDYLVKPFSARELVARVGGTLRLSHMRRDARRRTVQFETLLNEAPLGVYLVDSDFRIAAANPTARAVFGDIPDLIGRDFGEVLHTISQQPRADEVARVFRRTLETGEPYVGSEQIEHRRDRDATRYYDWQISRIPLLEGQFGVVCYFRDTSAHVQARREIEAARASAERANSAKSDFLAAMSHELRTPLNAIAGYLQLLTMGVHGPVSDEQRRVLERIALSERHLLSLITDVLNFAKIEAGKVEFDIEPVALRVVVAGVGAMIAPQLMTKGLTCETRIREGAIARGDREKIQQILLNLLSNATKFTPAGGRIIIDAPTRSDSASDAVYLRISDTGPGIARDKQDAIFEPFVQVNRGLSRPTEGTGLGLAISRDLARGMGGDLRVRSDVGAGSSFTLSMPAA
jgi:PAS domain S-box-containing protein